MQMPYQVSRSCSLPSSQKAKIQFPALAQKEKETRNSDQTHRWTQHAACRSLESWRYWTHYYPAYSCPRYHKMKSGRTSWVSYGSLKHSYLKILTRWASASGTKWTNRVGRSSMRSTDVALRRPNCHSVFASLMLSCQCSGSVQARHLDQARLRRTNHTAQHSSLAGSMLPGMGCLGNLLSAACF